MRRSRYRNLLKRQTIYLLFTLSIFVTCDAYSGSAFRGLLEERFNTLFSNNLKLDIGKIEGGIFRDIVSSNITISHPDLKRSFKLDRAELAHRLWYPLLRKFKIGMYPKHQESLKLFFGRDNPFLKGHFLFEGTFKDLIMKAYFSVLEDKKKHTLIGEAIYVKDSLYALGAILDKKIDINGLVDFQNKTLSFNMRMEKGEILVNGFFEENNLYINAGFRHVDFKGIDITGEMTSKIEPKGDTVNFDIEFKNLIINYSPFKNIKIKADISKEKGLLNISSISVGDKENEGIITGYAKAGIRTEKYLDLHLKINDLLLEEFILTKFDENLASGITSGELSVKGLINDLKTDAHFDIQNGRIQNLEFQSLIATLRGNGPIVNIEDGRIIKEAGNLIMSGTIDFSLFPNSKAFDNLKIETDKNVAVWSGWEISKRFEKIKAQKKLAKDITFSFEAYTNEDFLKTSNQNRESEIEVEYKFDKNESLKMKLKDEESFVGLQHKIKF